MQLTVSTFRIHFIVILTMLVLLPCTVKRELKQIPVTETHQDSGKKQSKIYSSKTCEVKPETVSKETVKLLDISPFTEAVLRKSFPEIPDVGLSASNIYILQKEKIPTHILYETFLI